MTSPLRTCGRASTDSARRGIARMWALVLLGVVVLGLVTGGFLIAPKLASFRRGGEGSGANLGEASPGAARASGTAEPPTNNASSADSKAASKALDFDQKKAAKGLGVVQQQLRTTIAKHRDPRPVVGRARRLVRRFPQYAPGRLSLAQTLLVVGDPKGAYKQLTRALAIAPGNASAQVLAGTTAMRLKRYASAEHHYSQAVGLDTDNAKYRLLLASALMDENQYDRARRTLLVALNIDSSLDRAHAALADLYTRHNQVNLALDQLQRALELVPADKAERRAAYHRKQAKLLLRANRPQEALAVMDKLSAKRRMSRGVSKEMVGIWMRLRKPEQAAAHFEQVLVFHPAAEWAARQAVHYRLQAGQLDKARRDLTMLRRINPRDPRISRYLQALREASSGASAAEGS